MSGGTRAVNLQDLVLSPTPGKPIRRFRPQWIRMPAMFDGLGSGRGSSSQLAMRPIWSFWEKTKLVPVMRLSWCWLGSETTVNRAAYEHARRHQESVTVQLL